MIELRSLHEGCAERRQDAVCLSCGARAFSVCARLSSEDLAQLDAIAERVSLGAGEVLAREDDPAVSVFNVTSGAVRIFKLLADGRRQIIGFLFAGDFIGLAAGERYGVSVEAIEDTTVCRFRRTEYLSLAHQRPTLEAALLDRAMHELAVARNQMMLLGRKTARERLASFLLDMQAREPTKGAGVTVRLPMTRSDIADYLGLTIETVSREITKLKSAGVVQALSLHELKIERPEQLRALAEGDA